MMEQLINQMEIAFEQLEKSNVLKLGAKFMRKTLDELIEAGFTREEAMQILLSGQIGISKK